MKATIKKLRAFSQMVNAKNTITVGSVIEVRDYVMGEYNGNPADYLICEHQGGILRMPLKEYFKLRVVNAPLFTLDDYGDVEIHTKFKILSVDDRTDLNGDIVYPHAAYNGYMYEEPDEDTYEFQELKNTGINPDWAYGCMKDYTVEIID